MTAHDFLVTLTLVLATAGVTTVLFQRLKLPVVLGYLLAGLLVGPNVAVPIYANRDIVAILSELGLILLLYSLGLEFSLRRLVLLAPRVGPAAIFQSGVLVWLGYLLGRAFGWSGTVSLFAGGVVAISSTTIIARAFDEQKVGGKLRELVIGILVVEDLIGILLIAVLTAVGSGEAAGAGALAAAGGRLAAFLAVFVVAGLLVVPRATRWLRRLDRPETMLVASIGFAFGAALLCHQFRYSVALGAFLAGSLMAESGEQHYLEDLVRPVRDLFAALFFVSVGMLIDPRAIVEHAGAIAAFTALVIAGKIGSVALGAFLSGHGTRTSVQAGLALAQIGEFGFIIAGLGLALGATDEGLSAIAVAVSALTTLTTPLAIRWSDRAADWVDRVMPRSWQTFSALYGSWIERLRRPDARRGARSLLWQRARWLAFDAFLFCVVVIAGAVYGSHAAAALAERAGFALASSRWLVLCATALCAVPFGLGMLRVSRRMSLDLAERALPSPVRGADLAAAPRRSFALALQLALLGAVALPLLALLQPFLPSLPTLAAALLLCGAFGWALQRGASNLQGHARAAAEVLADALASQSHTAPALAGNAPIEPAEPAALSAARQLLPGMGEPTALRVEAGSRAAGRTLGELRLRGRTGATVLALLRGERVVLMPGAQERLEPGDLLAASGTAEALDAARGELCAPRA
jgi:CPA2 family monovalent cation:H+ antiporter-2